MVEIEMGNSKKGEKIKLRFDFNKKHVNNR